MKLQIAGQTSKVEGARVGVDVGGTFTDVISHDARGRPVARKLLSTPPSYDRAVVSAVAELGVRAHEVVHGTTVATNAVLQRLGSATALVTTKGFRDVLELRRLRVPHMYDLFWRKPPPLVERRLRFEVDERVGADGTVVRPVDEREVRTLAATLRATGVESIAVCLLHAYAYPGHERELGRLLAEELPGIVVSLSSEILREQREYERTATTVVNAYVRPLMSSYLDRIRTGLGNETSLSIMQSSGGVMTAEDARARPVFALESGPAAGVVAALGLARRLGLDDVIAFDMGGTTAKASLIEDGALARGREYEVGGSLSAGSRLIRGSGELLRIPTIDIAEVGAGGGSLAWLDAGGGLQVGPRSAGAAPGPACYGLGGVEPTVTDANVVLGLLPAGPVADGQIVLSVELARAAVGRVASALGLELEAAASGIHRIANARMTRALRSVSSERGRDPREFAIVAYGGSGPVHAAGLAEDLGVRTVVVPAVAGLFSAVGLLVARPEFHEVRTCQLDVDTVDPGVVRALVAEMRAALVAAFGGEPSEWVATADLRYGGQSWEVEVALAERWPADNACVDSTQSASPPAWLQGSEGACDDSSQSPFDLAALRERFEDAHERLYGVRGQPGSPVEVRAVRLAALGPVPEADGLEAFGRDDPRAGVRLKSDTGRAAGSAEATRTLRGGPAPVEAPVRTRRSIGCEPEPGPLVVDEYDTTVVVPPGWSVRRDEPTASLVLERVT